MTRSLFYCLQNGTFRALMSLGVAAVGSSASSIFTPADVQRFKMLATGQSPWEHPATAEHEPAAAAYRATVAVQMQQAAATAAAAAVAGVKPEPGADPGDGSGVAPMETIPSDNAEHPNGLAPPSDAAGGSGLAIEALPAPEGCVDLHTAAEQGIAFFGDRIRMGYSVEPMSLTLAMQPPPMPLPDGTMPDGSMGMMSGEDAMQAAQAAAAAAAAALAANNTMPGVSDGMGISGFSAGMLGMDTATSAGFGGMLQSGSPGSNDAAQQAAIFMAAAAAAAAAGAAVGGDSMGMGMSMGGGMMGMLGKGPRGGGSRPPLADPSAGHPSFSGVLPVSHSLLNFRCCTSWDVPWHMFVGSTEMLAQALHYSACIGFTALKLVSIEHVTLSGLLLLSCFLSFKARGCVGNFAGRQHCYPD